MSLLKKLNNQQLKVLRPSGGCHNCPRKKIGFVPPVLEKGSIIWIDEAPGETDVEVQVPLSGKTGQYLRRLAKEAMVPEPWSFTTITHCQVPMSGKPNPKAIDCCLSQFVLDEIRDYSIVVLLGSALQAFFPGAKADHFRGNVAWHPDFPGQRFYAMYQPGYVVKHPELEGEYRQQLERLRRIAQGEPKPSWTVIRGPGALDAMREMVKRPLLSADFETNRLESWAADGRIKSLSVTADGKTVVAVHEDEPHFEACLRLLAEFCTKPEKMVLGAHIAFDLEWLERECGVVVACQSIHDVAVEYYHLRQYKMPSLKELVSKELDGYRFLIHNPHECQDADLLLAYNAEDVVHPLALFKKAMQGLKPKTRDLVSRVQGPAALVLQEITANGLYLRKDYRQQKIEEYVDKRRALISAWKAEDPQFTPTVHESGDGLIDYLYRVRRMPVLERTEGGVPSTDQSVLKQLQRDGYDIVKYPLEMRTIDKLQSTYLQGYDKHMWPDSRIRSHYPLTWTDSGRSSSRSPNLQNIPRKKEIRDLFGVPDGSVLLESDLSQIEFRIMVCLAGDQNGIEGYLRGEDAHTTTAKRASGSDKPTSEQRSRAKPINFGFLYGAHWRMVQALVADDYGVIWTDSEAEGFRNLFFETYPALPVFHQSSKMKLIANRGWFESTTGHIFYYEDWDHEDQKRRDHAARAALNAEAQGPAAQICMYIMVLTRRLLNERGFRSVKFVNHVHDSVMTEIPNPDWLPDVVQCFDEAVEMAHDWVKSWFIVPLIMEHKYGQSWGKLQDYKVGA